MSDCKIQLIGSADIVDTILSVLSKDGIISEASNKNIRSLLFVDKNRLSNISEFFRNKDMSADDLVNFLQEGVDGSIVMKNKMSSLIRDPNQLDVLKNDSKELIDVLANIEDTFSDMQKAKPIDERNMYIGIPHLLVALQKINEAIETETQLVKKNNIGKDVGINTNETSRARLVTTIGRMMVDINNYKVFHDNKFNSKVYAQIGDNIISAFESSGIISTNKDGKVIVNGIVDKDGKVLSDLAPGISAGDAAKANKMMGGAKGIIKGETVSISDSVAGKQANNLFYIHSATIGQLIKSIVPTTVKPPIILSNKTINNKTRVDWNKSPSVAFNKDSNTKKELTAIYKDLQSRGFKLDPTLIEGLKQISAEIKASGQPSIRAYFNKNRATGTVIKVGRLLGYNFDKTKLDMLSDSEYGKELSRISGLEDLLDSINEHSTDSSIFVEYFMARNHRTHNFNSILNVQTDKPFSRNVLQSATDVSYDTLEDKKMLIEDLVEHTQLTSEEILGGTLLESGQVVPSEEVSKFEKVYEAYVNSVNDKFFDKIDVIETTLRQAGFKDKDFWKMYAVLPTIKALREGIAEGNSVTSNFMVEADASASGAQIKFLLAVADSDSDAVFKYLEENKDNPDTDAYTLGADAIIEILNKPAANVEGSEAHKQKAIIASSLRLLYGNEDVSKARELLKYAIIKHLYGQAITNNQREIGNTIAMELLSDIEVSSDRQKTFKAVREFLKSIEFTREQNSNVRGYGATFEDIEASMKVLENPTTLDSQFNEVATELKNDLSFVLANSIGSVLTKDVVEPVYEKPYFSGYKKEVLELYGILNKASQGNNEIVGAISLIGNDTTNDNLDESSYSRNTNNDVLLKLTKVKETVGTTKQGLDYIYNEEHDNSTSADVVPIHEIDSTILLLTQRDLMNYAKTLDDNDPIKKEFEEFAIKMIHDAIQSSPRVTRKFSELYEKNLIKVTYMYDPRQAMVDSIRDNNKAYGVVTPAATEKRLKEIEARVKSKQKALASLYNIVENEDGTVTIGNVNAFSFATNYDKSANKAAKAKADRSIAADKEYEANTVDVSNISKEDTMVIINEFVDTISHPDKMITFDTETNGIKLKQMYEVAYNVGFGENSVMNEIRDVKLPEGSVFEPGAVTVGAKARKQDAETFKNEVMNHTNNADAFIETISNMLNTQTEGKVSLVAHNVDYDRGVLVNYLDAMDDNNPMKQQVLTALKDGTIRFVDTGKVFKALNLDYDKDNISLSSLVATYKVSTNNDHTAKADTQALLEVMAKMAEVAKTEVSKIATNLDNTNDVYDRITTEEGSTITNSSNSVTSVDTSTVAANMLNECLTNN